MRVGRGPVSCEQSRWRELALARPAGCCRAPDRSSRCSPVAATRSACSTSRRAAAARRACSRCTSTTACAREADGEERHCAELCRQLGVRAGGRAAPAPPRRRQPAGLGARAALPRGRAPRAGARRADRDRAHRHRPGRDDPLSPRRLARAARAARHVSARGPPRAAAAGAHARADRRLLPRARPAGARTPATTTTASRARACATRLLPALRAVHPAAEANVLRTAALLREEAELLDGLVDGASCEAPPAPSVRLASRAPTASPSSACERCRRRSRASSWSASPSRPPARSCRRPAPAWSEILALARRGGRAELHVGGRVGAVIEDGRLRWSGCPRGTSHTPPRGRHAARRVAERPARRSARPLRRRSARCWSAPSELRRRVAELGEEISRDYAGRAAAAGGGAQGRDVLPLRPDAPDRDPSRGRLHGRRLLRLGDRLLRCRADPQGPGRRDRGPRRADRRGHRRLGADPAVPAAQPRLAQSPHAGGLRAADQARRAARSTCRPATSASRSPTASSSATASTTPSATATFRSWRVGAARHGAPSAASLSPAPGPCPENGSSWYARRLVALNYS